MSVELYANISIGHENDWEIIKSRVVAAAQCNADAVIISKSTPSISIPEHQKYTRINSKWGSLPYIDVAKKSEMSFENLEKFEELIEHIGIPVIWSVRDSEAASWVKEFTRATRVKVHFDARDDWETISYCVENFDHLMYGGNDKHVDHLLKNHFNTTNKRRNLSLYHCATQFPAKIEEIDLSKLDDLRSGMRNVFVGYEGRCEGIFPDCAVVFKNVNFVEKHLGDVEQFNDAVLTHKEFYDFFINMNQLEIANGLQES
jgi:sialic acid synthase SpsE